MKKYFLLLFFFLSTFLNAQTEWKKENLKCPVCRHEQYYYVPVHNVVTIDIEAQYQLVFFPFTQHQSVFACTKCKYSALMDDFFNVDTNFVKKIEDIDISGLAVGRFKSYLDMDVTDRLLIAEKIYKNKDLDDEFWCRFYRICAYQFEREDYDREAEEYREKALELSQKMLIDRSYSEGREKEFLLISGSMFYFLNEPDSAYTYVREASMRTYTGNSRKVENVRAKENLLTRVSQQFAVHLRKEKLEYYSK
ncbi:MAG: hypothetical protein RBS19_06995 [Bacteroidales bacterium]|nr:hypothetical protein [Bacteroidales bacterium]MDY0216683.1 hypothetical protein [Bacteroidales bacterium]